MDIAVFVYPKSVAKEMEGVIKKCEKTDVDDKCKECEARWVCERFLTYVFGGFLS